MVSTVKVIGFYTDVFGNEIDEYEHVEKYSVCYKGHIFKGDTDGYNTFNTDKWEDAIGFYNTYANDMEVFIKDNEYDVTFADGDWS